MANYISFQPSDFFSTKLFTGNGTDDRAYTGVGFTPDFGWFKERDGTDVHFLVNTVMGANKAVYSNASSGIDTSVNAVKTFGADGYTLGVNSGVNENTSTYVNWNWKAGGAAATNSVGSVDASVSVNTTAGLSVSTFTANANPCTVGHGLGKVPEVIWVKADAAWNWDCFTTETGNANRINLNSTAAKAANTVWNSTSPTSTVFTINGYSGTFATAFCWTSIKGFSKFGTYEGNSNVNGPFIYTGFRPAYVLIKNIDRVEGWNLIDTKRSPVNLGTSNILKPNSTVAEDDDSTIAIDILSNGFKVRTTSTEINTSTSVYMAFAEFPFVSSNSKAGVAR